MQASCKCALVMYKDRTFIIDFVLLFTENEVDGDTLVTLIGVTPGPDSLKELIQKVGLRVKVYKLIKTCYQEDSVS